MKTKNTITALIATTIMCAFGIAHAETPLSGSWLVESWNSEDGSIDAQPGLWIFTNDHYSIMFATGSEARPGYDADAGMTDDEKMAAYDTLTANAGRYEIDGNILKTYAFIAKDTNYMGGWPDNEATYEFSIDGDKLTIKNLTFAVDFTATLRQVENTPMPGRND